VFNYSWDGTITNLEELNQLLDSGLYSVGAVFDCVDNKFEKGKFVFVLNRLEQDMEESDDESEGDYWKRQTRRDD
jgi:hypothetical protein